MRSMTGYADLHAELDGCTCDFRIKSYNSRFFDLIIHLPARFSALEFMIRRFFAKRIVRGKVEVSIKIITDRLDADIVPNIAIARAYLEAVSHICTEMGLKPPQDLSSFLTTREGVLQTHGEVDASQMSDRLIEILEELFEKYDHTRRVEGKALIADINEALEGISEAIVKIEENTKASESLFAHIIQKRCTELGFDPLNHDRLMQEVAALLIKYTLNEEIIRLKTHLDALKNELRSNDTPGRKIDFICQEMNREINTIGSKSQDVKTALSVVEIKNLLENVREQARNIE